MILPFSTSLNNKPTYFVEKTHIGLIENDLWEGGFDVSYAPRGYSTSVLTEKKAKIHTFREDLNNLWKAGNKIDFFINTRTKDMFRFAPVLPVLQTQNVLMTYHSNDVIQISVDERELFGYHERLAFAINDGFDTWEDFFEYFYPRIMKSKKKVLTGKIIHWTNYSY